MAMLHLLHLTRLTTLHLRSTAAAGTEGLCESAVDHCHMSFFEKVGVAQVGEGCHEVQIRNRHRSAKLCWLRVSNVNCLSL